MSKRDPKPEVLRLEELAILVKNGEIKLPKFQRPFVWRRNDMLKLMDSIYKGYPIGSLLLWHSSQKLKSEREIAGLLVDEGVTLYPTNYLLDGQQRLTTLCGALFWNGFDENSIWNIHFDLENEEFLYPKNNDQVTNFPLNKLVGTSDFIKQCMKFEHHSKKSILIERSENLLRAIKDYKIAVVKIGDMSVEEVAPIFERINSTGRKLTMVDLMMAATWSDGFDLSQEIESIRETCKDAGIFGLSDQIILKSIAASAGYGLTKEDIQKLRNLNPNELKIASAKCQEAFGLASEWLKKNINVNDISHLPYALFINYLVEIFRLKPQITDEDSNEIKSWFWFTSVSSYFSGANTGKITRDMEHVRNFSQGIIKNLFVRETIDISKFILNKFNLRTASSKAFALMLINNKPERNIKDEHINYDLYTIKGSEFFTQLAPSALLGKNISIIIDPINKNYSKNLKAINKQLSDHLLDEEIITSSKNNDIANFLDKKSLLIKDFIQRKTGCEPSIEIDINSISPEYDEDEEIDD